MDAPGVRVTIAPTEDDIGRRVTYPALPAGKIEEGVITSLSPLGVFVRYGMNAASALTPLDRLEWSTKTEEQSCVKMLYRGGGIAEIDWCEPPVDPASLRN